MFKYEIKLEKISQITSLPDSQRLFGFLMSYSKKHYSDEDISNFAKEVLEKKKNCMLSNLIPTGYYPTPKEYIMKKLAKRLEKNPEKIESLEKTNEKIAEKIDKLRLEIKGKIKELKNKEKKKFNENSKRINHLSSKNIYEAIKKMEFINKDSLKTILCENNEIITVEELEKLKYLKKNQNFIQKFRLESQIKELPGFPNVAYSLPIISYYNQEKEQKEFSFFVKVDENSILAKTLENLKKEVEKNRISCFLGAKGSSGYNEYSIYEVQKIESDEKNESKNTIYLNLGMLLPNIEKIDMTTSILNIHTSDRNPFDIRNDIPKVISFIAAGSVIKKQDEMGNIFEIGKSIPNKYNLLYKNAIVFGNSYIEKLEV